MTDETQAAKPPSSTEDEFKAMVSIAAAIESLTSADARRRVIAWAADRYGVSLLAAGQGAGREDTRSDGTGNAAAVSGEPSEFVDFADLYNAAGPTNDQERILTAGYWLQRHQGEQNLHADNVNHLLTPLGQRIGRVRDVLPDLLAGRPALAIRVSKGKTAQARVGFRLTTAGLAAVDAALETGGFGA